MPIELAGIPPRPEIWTVLATLAVNAPLRPLAGDERRDDGVAADHGAACVVEDVAVAAPEAESELAVGFFGSRFERATPGERDYLRAMADAAVAIAERGEEPLDDIQSVPTSDVAAALDKKPQSLSPARDSLLKKGLIYSGERGRIAFTVPHFGRYLREHA